MSRNILAGSSFCFEFRTHIFFEAFVEKILAQPVKKICQNLNWKNHSIRVALTGQRKRLYSQVIIRAHKLERQLD